MPKRPLPVRYRPHRQESFQGYLLRLAYHNGWGSLQELLSALCIPAPRHYGNQLPRLAQALAPRLRLDPGELIAHFMPTKTPSWVYEEARMIQDLAVPFPRLCPLCVTETGFHWHWSLALVSHCPIHKHPLWDCCPQCQAPLEWNADLFHRCPTCQHPWQPCPESDLPAHQQQFWLRFDNPSAMIAWCHDLTAALYSAARPLDHHQTSIGRIPPTARDLVTRLERAYGLLTDSSLQQAWCGALNRQSRPLRALPSNTPWQPIKRLQRGLQESWPLKSFRPEKVIRSSQVRLWKADPPAYWLKPRRLSCSAPEDLPFQVTGHEIAEVLRVEFSALRHLLDDGTLTPLNEVRIARDALFDLRQAVALLKRIPEVARPPAGTVVVKAESSCLKRHGCSHGALLAWILRARRRGYRPEGQGHLATLWVHEAALQAFLLAHLHQLCQADLPVQQACSILAVAPTTLKKKIRAGAFKLARCCRHAERIDGPSLWDWLVAQRQYGAVPHEH